MSRGPSSQVLHSTGLAAKKVASGEELELCLFDQFDGCWDTDPCVEYAGGSHISPSKYLQPLQQLIVFDPVRSCERALLTHAFLKTASSPERL